MFSLNKVGLWIAGLRRILSLRLYKELNQVTFGAKFFKVFMVNNNQGKSVASFLMTETLKETF